MVISHKFQYCFFAIPRTASKALSDHLMTHYKGEEIKPMHISYQEFMDRFLQYSEYKTFTIIRNPMDSVVSSYFKKKMDHNGRFSRGTFKEGRPIGVKAMKEYRFIRDKNASFAEYFKEFHSQPYIIPRHQSTASKVDQVLRFESLQDDFKSLIESLQLDFIPIPKINPTSGRAQEFSDYYTLEIRKQAMTTFESIMEEWAYSFPESWK